MVACKVQTPIIRALSVDSEAEEEDEGCGRELAVLETGVIGVTSIRGSNVDERFRDLTAAEGFFGSLGVAAGEASSPPPVNPAIDGPAASATRVEERLR